MTRWLLSRSCGGALLLACASCASSSMGPSRRVAIRPPLSLAEVQLYEELGTVQCLQPSAGDQDPQVACIDEMQARALARGADALVIEDAKGPDPAACGPPVGQAQPAACIQMRARAYRMRRGVSGRAR